jgi:hypothetical protein
VASYSAVIDLRVNGLEQLKEIEDRVKAVQNIQKRLKPIPSIFDKRASAQVKEAKDELSSYVKEVAKGTAEGGHFSKTMAGLNAQMRAFNTVAANSNAGSEDFVNSIIAAEKASRRLTEAEIDRLQVLSKIYTQQQGVGRTTATEEIINLYEIIPKSIAGLELYEQQLREAQRQAVSGSSDYRELAQAIAEVNRQLDIARGIGPVQGPALPPGFTKAGATGFPRSPLSARPKTGTARKGSPLVGAAFPALFGAGPAGILGGFVGEFFGPLGGVVGSALGAPVDAFVAEVAKTGVALTSASGTFELVKEKSLFSSEEVKKLAYALEEQGKVQELATLLTTDLAKQIGSQGVTALQQAGTETKEFTRLVNLLFTQLGAFVAGPLSDFLRFINNALGSVTTNVQFRSFEASLQGNQAKRFAEIVAEERGGETTNVRGGGRTQFVPGTLTTDVQRRALARAEKEGIAPKVTGLTTFEDTQTVRPPKGRTGISAGEREAERVAKALIQQRAITLEIQRQSEFGEKIAAAELAKDPVLARRIQEQQELAELGVQTAKQLELEKNTSVQLAIARTAQAKADLIRKKTAQDIAKTEQERQEKFADVLAGLEYQIEYENAVTREKRNQLELDEKARKLKKDGFTPAEIDTLIGFEKTIQKQKEPLAKFITDSEEQLKDLQQVAVNVSQGIGNAIANSMSQGIVGLIEGTKDAQQVFADFLKSVGDILIQEGTRMIAMYIAIGIAKAFAGLAAGSNDSSKAIPSTGNPAAPTVNGFDTGMNALVAAEGAYWTGGFQAFANGGMVTSPTMGLVGEGGEPEYIIPASKMRGAMNRYAAGARGSSVIPGSGEQAAGEMGGGTAVAAPIDVRYTVERINSVDYVTADQFRSGMQQAAEQGARRGEQRTLANIRQNTTTRRKLGL